MNINRYSNLKRGSIFFTLPGKFFESYHRFKMKFFEIRIFSNEIAFYWDI